MFLLVFSSDIGSNETVFEIVKLFTEINDYGVGDLNEIIGEIFSMFLYICISI